MPKDWIEWHDQYNTDPRLQQRLQLVRESLAQSLNVCPPGIIRIVSLCAGDGRDLIGTLSNHPRAKDVRAKLVELNPQLVERGRTAIKSAGLDKQVEFVNGDATISSNYMGGVPADIVILCGVFGSLANEGEMIRLIKNLSFFCKKGSFLVWSRRVYGPRKNNIPYSDTVLKLLHETDFEEISLKLTLTEDSAVGIHRYMGEGLAMPKDQELFVYPGIPPQ